jgi:drug/metabolite transporter (DMT)-like permease
VVVAVLASLGAALLYAVASVLQHRAAVAVDSEHSMRLGLLARLIAKPWWVAGVCADGLAFVMQFFALGHGPLIVVQPLMVAGLLFALPLGAWVSGNRIRAAELRAAGLVVVGLALLLLLGNPSHGTDALSPVRWVALIVAIGVPAIGLVLVAGRTRFRPTLLAAAAALIYGFTAALAKVSAHELSQGVGDVLGSWELWALIPAGLLGMIVCQSAFQAGPLRTSLPTLTAVDPVVSIAIGVLAFHEQIEGHPLRVICALAGVAVMVAGVMLLGTSPLVALEEPAAPEGRLDDAHRA